MELQIKSGFKRLKKHEFILIFEFLDDIDLIKIKNLNSFSKQYFRSKLESLRIYRYVLNYNYNKTSNDLRSHKIRILNLVTNSNFLNRAKTFLKVDEDAIVEVCLKLANHHHELEMKILENNI
jgi:hypothetical protein